MHHAGDGYLLTHRRHQNRVAGFKPFHLAANAVQDQVIEIDLTQQPALPEVAHRAQGTAVGRSTGDIECIQRCGEGADVIRSGALHIAHNVHANAPDAEQRDVHFRIFKLPDQRQAHDLLGLCQGLAGDLHGAGFRKIDSAGAIHHARQFLRDTSPDVDAEPITGA